jgi:hypothetical protein
MHTGHFFACLGAAAAGRCTFFTMLHVGMPFTFLGTIAADLCAFCTQVRSMAPSNTQQLSRSCTYNTALPFKFYAMQQHGNIIFM